MVAVANHQRDVVDALLRAGGEVNARDSSRNTPLEMAVRDLDADTAVVRLLLDAGADPCHLDEEGHSIVDMSKDRGPILKAMAQKAYDRCKA